MLLERVGPVVAAVVVTAALVAVLPDEHPVRHPAPDPVPSFLAAYERSRTVEVAVTSTFTRTFPDGRDLSYEQRLLQRPPEDRLVIGAGSASGRLGGQVLRCNVEGDGPPRCVRGTGTLRSYDEEVADEVAELDELVDPDAGPYEVTVDDAGCYELRLIVAMLTPPYGQSATFCFDAASGALAELTIDKVEAVDHVVATEIRTEVTDADLEAADLGESISTAGP